MTDSDGDFLSRGTTPRLPREVEPLAVYPVHGPWANHVGPVGTAQTGLSRRVVPDDQVVLEPEQLVESAHRTGLRIVIQIEAQDGAKEGVRYKPHERVHLY